MSPVRCCLVLLALGFSLDGLPPARAAETAAKPEIVHVAHGFDQAAFDYSLARQSVEEAFAVDRLSFPSPVTSPVEQNNTVPGEYYRPKLAAGAAPRPAVICLHILGGGGEDLVRLQCTALAKRGIPALWFRLPYYGPRALPGGLKSLLADPPRFASALVQATADVRRAVDVLASRPEVDRRRIGLWGVSLGGIVGATAAAEEPRCYRAALILAGGDLLPIVHAARETSTLSAALKALSASQRATAETALRDFDPLQHAAALRERAQRGQVLMVNATADEVIPPAATQKLAAGLGISDRVVWLEGLGHYTAMAALPQVLQQAVDFFAQDLPADAVAPPPQTPAPANPRQMLAGLLRQCGDWVGKQPQPGHCHRTELNAAVTLQDGKKLAGEVRIVRGPQRQFALRVRVAGHVDAEFGYDTHPWLASAQKVFRGVLPAEEASAVPPLIDPRHQEPIRSAAGLINVLAAMPELLDQWTTLRTEGPPEQTIIHVTQRDRAKNALQVAFREDAATPRSIEFNVAGVHGALTVGVWQIDAPAAPDEFAPPVGRAVQPVAAADVGRMQAALVNLALDLAQPPRRSAKAGQDSLEIVARDPEGHGLLGRTQGKTVLIVAGTPAEMGRAQGTLLREPARRLVERVVYGVGAADSLASGVWSLDRFAEIKSRVGPHVPPRFVTECDALAAAAGVSTRDARVANLLPERFHCSGLAVRGKATADGRVLHARVLDYMRDIGLQDFANVTVFLPERRHAWISVGYAGFIGTVTAMNERGLAVGEMGGRGEGQWDGMPMSLLLREIMERAATVDEALAILRQTPRTCEYYYVFSDRSRAIAGAHCDPQQVELLLPGQQHPRLPQIPEDTVLISGDQRAQTLAARVQKEYGRIDVPAMIELIKRPVSMNSNLHDAIFSPETLELWAADAGRWSAACDEPYAHFNLQELLKTARQELRVPPAATEAQ